MSESASLYICATTCQKFIDLELNAWGEKYLIEGNAIFYPGTINSFLWAGLRPLMSSPFDIESFRAIPFFPFKWRSLIGIMSKTLLLRTTIGRDTFFKGSPITSKYKSHGGIAITCPCPEENHDQNISPFPSPPPYEIIKQPVYHSWPWTTCRLAL